MKKLKLKNYLKLGTLLLGISLIFTNCQKEDDFKQTHLNSESNYKFSKLTFNQFEEKSDSKTLNFIDPSLDFVKERIDINSRDIISNDGSFTISTEEIIEVTTDTTATYIF